MSILPFSESTNKTGLYEVFQRLTKTNPTSYDAYKFATDANMALASYFIDLAIPSSGKWQVDDTNQADYPEIKINLVSGQYDYPLTTDASSPVNQILDIERIECATESTASASGFKTLPTYDEMKDEVPSIVAARSITGVPSRYSKRANGLFVDPTPNFSATEGLRVFFARTPSYFVGTDTTKTAGIPDSHQAYLIYKPAYLYCITSLPQLAGGYLVEINKLEEKIKAYYARRNRDERLVMTSKRISFR